MLAVPSLHVAFILHITVPSIVLVTFLVFPLCCVKFETLMLPGLQLCQQLASFLLLTLSNTSMPMPSNQAQSCRNFQLALFLLAESEKGRDSAWYPYISTLPQHVDSLVHWSDTELHELQYGATEPEQHFLQEVCKNEPAT